MWPGVCGLVVLVRGSHFRPLDYAREPGPVKGAFGVRCADRFATLDRTGLPLKIGGGPKMGEIRKYALARSHSARTRTRRPLTRRLRNGSPARSPRSAQPTGLRSTVSACCWWAHPDHPRGRPACRAAGSGPQEPLACIRDQTRHLPPSGTPVWHARLARPSRPGGSTPLPLSSARRRRRKVGGDLWITATRSESEFGHTPSPDSYQPGGSATLSRVEDSRSGRCRRFDGTGLPRIIERSEMGARRRKPRPRHTCIAAAPRHTNPQP